MLQNEIEHILEKMYPAELAGLHLQRNAEYDSCDFSRASLVGQISDKLHVEVELKSFRKGIFEDEFPTINTITSSERDYFAEVLALKIMNLFVLLYYTSMKTTVYTWYV